MLLPAGSRVTERVRLKVTSMPPFPCRDAACCVSTQTGHRAYNASVKSWDVIIVGGGIIGLSLSIALHKRGGRVLVVERGEPGREASHAAAGMLADCTLEAPAALQPLATASARMYPEFVHELQDESGINLDLRDQGTLLFPPPEHVHERPGFTTASLLPSPLAELEPALAEPNRPAIYLRERSVDPRALAAGALKAAKHRGVDVSSGTAVTAVLVSDGRVSGVSTHKTSYMAPAVVNCAGAWASRGGQLRNNRKFAAAICRATQSRFREVGKGNKAGGTAHGLSLRLREPYSRERHDQFPEVPWSGRLAGFKPWLIRADVVHRG